MYNDEHNLYHYTYRKDGSELSHQRETVRPGGQSGPQGPVWEAKSVKKNRLGLKITALALSCALLGGAAGGGAGTGCVPPRRAMRWTSSGGFC